jgi:hypothetical protein
MIQLPDLLGIASAGAVAGFAKTMVRLQLFFSGPRPVSIPRTRVCVHARVVTAGARWPAGDTQVSHPLDTIKVHVQNKRVIPKNMRALYRGIAVPFVRNGIEHSSHFFFRGLVASAIHSSGMPGADNAWLVRACTSQRTGC